MSELKKDQLSKLEAADWDKIENELCRYVNHKVRTKRWRSGAFLPKGMEPVDLVSIVVVKTFNAVLGKEDPELGGFRNWNEMRYPALIDHLKAGIDSEISKLVRSEEHKKTNYSAKFSADEAQNLYEDSIDKEFCESADDNLSDSIEHEEFDEFIKSLYVALADDDISTKVLKAYQELAHLSEVVKPAQAAVKLNINIEVVRNSIKRIMRAADKTKRELEESSYGK